MSLQRQDNINRHMCHMRMSLKAQTHFNTIRNVRMRLRHCPPISVLTTPYALKPCPYHPYACVVPSQHASDTAYHPYAHRVPSRHASDTAYHPYAHGVPSRHAPNTAYHPYACGVPSRHAPDTAYHPYACGVPSRHCLFTMLWLGFQS
ncbi:hypothetical protein O181_122430 [Austropuccinia psidii MF-1]|uniref:Uncharacterized protein n=1 Tax=Austropuccinia psidii MF-1 TaxID=1389203 RepID=A0A9Q3KP66_9BASI|nr:hypothetical protein [Austropuccinia psidii MF-1]